jgi:tetratricopeptide (TPR) repeat protein
MATAEQLNQAIGLIQNHQHADAEALLTPLLNQSAADADVWQLIALARKGQLDLTGAEIAFKQSIDLHAAPAVVTNLGNLYRQMGREEDALACYNRALEAAPSHLPARVNKGRSLLAVSRLGEAISLYTEILEALPEHANARIGLAQSLQRSGQIGAATLHFEKVLAHEPENAAALNGLGVIQKVSGHPREACRTLKLAVTSAPAAPEVRINLASALALSGEESEAISAYREALWFDPLNPELHDWFNGYLSTLAHPEYLHSYARALDQHPTAGPLAIAYARKLLLGHQGKRALQVLAAVPVDDAKIRAYLACERSHILREMGEFDEAVITARDAHQLLPDLRNTLELATAIMAAGTDYEEALACIRPLTSSGACGQDTWATYTTALRYAGRRDEYDQLVDYEKYVGMRHIETPEGYDNPTTFLQALRDHMKALHITRHHPVGQSLQHGTQTLDDLFSRDEPIIDGLKMVLTNAIQSFTQGLPSSVEHPVSNRYTGEITFSDSWSVLLRKMGFHKNHYHSHGWLSSAFYLTVPDVVSASGKEGWIKFGEPGFRAREPLSPEHWLQPEEGALAIFPSYLWHGTEALQSDVERMTVGFDVLPAPA